MLRSYISRVENGHTVPSVETLEKLCRALEVPLYQLFYEGDGVLEPPKVTQKAPAGARPGTKRGYFANSSRR